MATYVQRLAEVQTLQRAGLGLVAATDPGTDIVWVKDTFADSNCNSSRLARVRPAYQDDCSLASLVVKPFHGGQASTYYGL